MKTRRKRRSRRRGRPPRRDNPVRVHVRLPGPLYEWVRRFAEERERSRSDVITAAVQLLQYKDSGDEVVDLLKSDLAAATRLSLVKKRDDSREKGPGC